MAINTERNYYKILHVQPDAPDQVIKASYRTMMQRLRMHPDLGGDHLTAALINEAFRTIGDPVRRALYDRWLARTGQQVGDEPEVQAAAPTFAACHFCNKAHGPSEARDPDGICDACGASLFPAQLTNHDAASRRAITRVPRNLRITVLRAVNRRDAAKGITQDISLNGARFLTHTQLALDERLLIDCEFCSAVAIVRSVRTHKVDTDGFEVGVQFLTLRVKRQRGGLISTVA
jgi:DnaJ-class molecular chaperone